ncbi:MAG: D-glycero-beta-D-manno-heptose 1-phosphate adenylyltransferase [Chthonomonadales bacterium]|nr:D-glycero-beta-D-manno-heptose 1-phosphate adenylyltransferase [Chthonomonadales bacterium]
MRDKVLTRPDLALALDARRQRGERIVFTNGCFDLLHIGHARYLTQARALGDALVVGLNSDASVRVLKGPSRPIVPEDERAEMLAHLECVSFVSIFDEPRPDDLIALVRPAIHVKGGDYRAGELPEARVVRQHGGRVVIMPLVEGKSTTAVIARILDVIEREADSSGIRGD